MELFKDNYCSELNSPDKYDVDIAMSRNRAQGGTMVLWRRALDKYISTFPVTSPSFLPVIFSPPGCPVSAHKSIYLPTAGKEVDFLDQLTQLSMCIYELREKYQDCLVFIRGDSNVNPNNTERTKMFSSFLGEHDLHRVHIVHKTYHHFLGGGAFDSNIDTVLHTKEPGVDENIITVFCKLEHPDLDSHHDAILSSFSIPRAAVTDTEQDLVNAPRVNLPRFRILWSEEGKVLYQQHVAGLLHDLRSKWMNPLSRTSLAILLAQTNTILLQSAKATNKYRKLNMANSPKSGIKPKVVKASEYSLKIAKANRTNDNGLGLSEARKRHRALLRSIRNSKQNDGDVKFFDILSSRPSSAFVAIRAAKSTTPAQVPYVTVGGKKYFGKKVVDGLYSSVKDLKTSDPESFSHSKGLMEDYHYIKLLCANKFDLPCISMTRSKEILLKLKPSVTDFFSITSQHYINAGSAGLAHFNLLLNVFICDVNNCTIEELNTVLALLLYKGHGKEKTLDTSYRTISTCPLLAKSLDIYIRDLCIRDWNNKQAITQYQGESSSHELASILVTEAVQLSKYSKSLPTFLLFLDARSAFDTVVIPYLIRNLYLAGTNGDSLTLIKNRLLSRKTFCQFDKEMVGPISDERGVEQGGVSSSDFYKVYNNELLTTAQQSKLGVVMEKSFVLSAVGQADDTVLLSNDIFKLQLILQLVLNFCKKFDIKLNPTKTKLLVVPPARNPKFFVPHNPVNIDGTPVEIVDQTEHVGVLRSSSGNLPNILQRITSFKNAMRPLLSCGLARGSRSNPVASIKILSIYATPVLVSGLGSLVLTKSEYSSLDQQYKRSLQNLLKLSVNSPQSLVYFVAGSLPLSAIIHQRMLSLFMMICHLPADPLHSFACHTLLTASPSSSSWIMQVRNLLLQYHLPHPMDLLVHPPSKTVFKRLVESKITDFWENKLRCEAAPVLSKSLRYFRPQFLSLKSPHRILQSAGSKPYEVAKAIIQLKFMSSQYNCGHRTRHWSPNNPEGLCTFPACFSMGHIETPEHILLYCPAYSEKRETLLNISLKNLVSNGLAVQFLGSSETTNSIQFLLDPTTIPEVIRASQIHGDYVINDILYLGRTWCFSQHRERLKRLCLWNFS